MKSSVSLSHSQLKQQRQYLELMLQSPEHQEHRASRLGRFLQAMGSNLMQALTHGHEPRIRCMMEGGTEVWKVYDPTTHRTYRFSEEAEVWTWLDQRYYL